MLAMAAASSVHAPYAINPRMISSIKSPGSMAILGLGAPFELPIGFFQVLMAFAEPRTAAQAFELLDVDVDAEEFGRIISDFVERGMLTPHRSDDDGYGLQEVLAPRVFGDAALVEQIGGWMRQGRAIVIPDALPADFAEDVQRDLCQSSHWKVREGGQDFFGYRSSTLSYLHDRSPALARCSRLFKSNATRRFIAGLSGQDCGGRVSVDAAWYRPGDHALPHNDMQASEPRSVAYLWYLAKDWQREWGGALFWCPTGQYISPRFNLLVMFNVTPANVHLVCPVSPAATAKRLTITGFWHRSQPWAPSPAIDPDAVLSPRAYGPPAPDLPDHAPLFVL
jgi:2OG-Fe(II) oxygenase superfamily